MQSSIINRASVLRSRLAAATLLAWAAGCTGGETDPAGSDGSPANGPESSASSNQEAINSGPGWQLNRGVGVAADDDGAGYDEMVDATVAAGCAVDVLEPEPPVEHESASLNVRAAPVEEHADDTMGANADCTGSPDDLYAEPSVGTADAQMAELDGEAVSGATSPIDPSEEASIIAPLGKKCWATCTVVNYGTGFCPATIGGYGHTTFLGGCGKACNKAKGDAASKLPPSCVINNCNFSGC